MARDGDAKPEVRARVKAMASTVGSIRRPILTVSAVGAPVRLSVMSSLAVTRLTYNAHVLAPLPASQ
eukprot:2588010-Alexandrium_andersonii.AAC.1